MTISEVQLPDIGEGVTEGELVRWLVKSGDKVNVDQPVAEVMTDKATVEVPSPVSGVVAELFATEGEMIPIGKKMLSIQGSGETTAESAPSAPATAQSAAPAVTMARESGLAATYAGSSVAALSGSDLPPANADVLATPGTRRLARELKVDINELNGTGIAGRVTREDVLSSVHPSGHGVIQSNVQVSRGMPEERVALRGIRKKIAENMQLAKQIVPHFTLMEEANVTSLVQLREQVKTLAEKQGVKVTYLPFVMKALIATIREFPMFNASIDDQAHEIVYKKYYHLGFAADTPNGLLVPVVKDADQKTVLQISREIIDLSTRAREGKLKPEEMKGATITITNIGSVGGSYATPIINHPEVAILGMYRIVDKPLWSEGTWKPIKSMNFTITADHRLIDGAVAANFLKSFLTRIENPGALVLDMI